MAIVSISPTSFRNLSTQELKLDPHVNIISGSNGSGKTSILEAIYILSTGRSFRTRQLDSIISRGEVAPSSSALTSTSIKATKTDAFYINGRIATTKSEQVVGLKKSRTEKMFIKLDGEAIRSASKLAELSPTLVIEPGNIVLLSGPPQTRRRFIDWGVFHVEQNFSKLWKDYINCVKQRNSLLRTARIDRVLLGVWDQKLSKLGDDISKKRKAYLEHLGPILSNMTKVLGLNCTIKLKYSSGWEKSLSLLDSLQKHQAKDLARRFTSVGPHRMDLQIYSGEIRASELLSRGQQKILTIAMYLSQVAVVQELSKKAIVVLLDDLSAELDDRNVNLVFEKLLALDTQLVCTTLDHRRMLGILDNLQKYKVFHVEHGVFNDENKI